MLDFTELRIAMETGGHIDRGLLEGHTVDEHVRTRMSEHGVSPDRYDDISTLAHAFAMFAQDVRAAVQKDRPIIPHFNERFQKKR